MSKRPVAEPADARVREDDIDLWAPVPTASLPEGIVRAVTERDWGRAKHELQQVMDGITTDGAYGRALLQLVRQLPVGVDPVLDRYRAAVAIDYGEWDVLTRVLEASPVEAREIVALRECLLAPASRRLPKPNRSVEEAPYAGYEYILGAAHGWLRRWARQLPRWEASSRWSRPDVPVGRHLRIRQLHHETQLAVGEALAGRLDVAAALATSAAEVGDEGEPLRDLAIDLNLACEFALGGELRRDELRLFRRAAGDKALSPLGTLEFLLNLAPFLAVMDIALLERGAGLMRRIAARLAVPRAALQANAWHAAIAIRSGGPTRRQLLALAAETRHAHPPLRVLPLLLTGVASRNYSDLTRAEAAARRAGNVWAQIAALVHLVSIDPTPRTARALDRLLAATGWRRPVLAGSEVVSECALGMAAVGVRSRALLEFALSTGRATCAVDVAVRHAVDAGLESSTRLAALEALHRIGTTHARSALERVARGSDVTARDALALLQRKPLTGGLTEREVEVIALAGQGLTNRQIAERLVLSEHTVARHLVNARDKLGAANRADAAVRLGQLVRP